MIRSFCRHYGLSFRRPQLLKLALTHRSYLSVTGQGPRESNERLEYLGDSVLGLVTSEFLYRKFPDEHEGQLTKTKSLLVSKAILSRRALAMGLGRFVLMSHSEVESGGRQRLSILADAFESVVGAIYLDQGFEAAREFIQQWLLKDSSAIVADKRHTNFKSHLQEFVQSTYRTHPVYRIRSQIGPDHSKQFNVEVMVSRKVLGVGQGHNKKEAEQAAARNALEQVEGVKRRRPSERRPAEAPGATAPVVAETDLEARRRRRRGRRGGRGRRAEESEAASAREESPTTSLRERRREREVEERPETPVELEPLPRWFNEYEEVGRPEGPLEERHVDPYAIETEASDTEKPPEAAPEPDAFVAPQSGRVENQAEPDSPPAGEPSNGTAATPGPIDEDDATLGVEPERRKTEIPYGRRSRRPSRSS